jgi:sialic acid synthase SpsE/mannose-6-phosphate isomerase-like protein (cupin superfamily)
VLPSDPSRFPAPAPRRHLSTPYAASCLLRLQSPDSFLPPAPCSLPALSLSKGSLPHFFLLPSPFSLLPIFVQQAPLFILEMANNHMGDVAHGIRIIRELKEACAGFPFRFAIKLQYRYLPDFIHPAFRERMDLKFVKRFSETALCWDDYRKLKDAIVEHGFLSMCTPWDEKSVEMIAAHGYDFLKVPSCYLTDWPLAEKIATVDLPLVISTAGEPFEEIDRIVSFYQHRQKTLAIMHCVGEYPTADANLQLNQIDLLRQRYQGVEIGYSTHEAPEQMEAVMMAVAKGATLFEKHVGVPTERYPLNAYSANPVQVRRWLEAAQRAVAMNGTADGRHQFSAAEKKTLGELRRAVFVRHDAEAGETLQPENIFVAIPGRPGQLTANDLSKYAEYKLKQAVRAGEGVMLDNVLAIDTRSAVHGIVRDVKALLKRSGVIVPGQLELEISHHYGIERFREFGSTTVTVVNREYCKRVILMLPGQTHPEQWHEKKHETYHLLYGEIELRLDGEIKTYRQNDVVLIAPGVRHQFSSTKGAVVEEISSAYEQDDSFYTDKAIASNGSRKTYVTNWID